MTHHQKKRQPPMAMSPLEPSHRTVAIAPDAANAPGLKNQGLNDAPLGPQFSLRTLLVATAIGAAVAAAAGIAYRAAPAGARATLLILWLTIAATFAGYLAFQWRAHVRRLALAGPIRFALQRPDLRSDSKAAFILATFAFLCFASLLIFSLSMTVLFTLHWINLRSGPGALPTICFGGIFGFMMVAAIHFLYRPRAADPLGRSRRHRATPRAAVGKLQASILASPAAELADALRQRKEVRRRGSRRLEGGSRGPRRRANTLRSRPNEVVTRSLNADNLAT